MCVCLWIGCFVVVSVGVVVSDRVSVVCGCWRVRVACACVCGGCVVMWLLRAYLYLALARCTASNTS